ncbi:TetR family transcriptional regulator [Curtobacterium sp. MCJR17_055]|uniref:TetR/AcrR family transcriptional regulator n=1 Tax=unclassified Curtobacterium TaxID=257496 RepID=UPI000D90731F|nr:MULTISPECIES: TetR/AcrR family transcriptional regulator [unclassified Curtobacterium]PYY33261.1 TetR family transcriptional regulator [Curtobacterium sp. MCBD17_029]PYY36617.1 TetR family transcriptional regulator [Curtobacterium sp. MCPF17_046]PYY53204.1 TetR family transcriptional regulator [Curtobacterium sp. MCJR17_055]PYY56359.1 TetR family transcriptional regulator [Curtobacterium sp. MCPF17_015]PZE90101.1 TetR family transcriptional regulator [Curtobacterium sp. MCBD17_008]
MARRGSYAKGIAKREEILSVALELVATQGFRRTSIKDIADAVGLTQAGLLHYFDSKDELWVAILRRRDDLDNAAQWDAPDFAALLAAVVRHNAEVPGLVQMFVNLSAAAATDPDHPAHAYFRERYETTRARMTDDFRRMQQDGRLRTDLDPEELASVLLATSDGMQIQWLYDPTRDMAEHVELVTRLAMAQVTTGS